MTSLVDHSFVVLHCGSYLDRSYVVHLEAKHLSFSLWNCRQDAFVVAPNPDGVAAICRKGHQAHLLALRPPQVLNECLAPVDDVERYLALDSVILDYVVQIYGNDIFLPLRSSI